MEQVLHYHRSQWPFLLLEQVYTLKDLLMYLQPVGLFEADDQEAVMLLVPVL
jgi:hypothetical protein